VGASGHAEAPIPLFIRRFQEEDQSLRQIDAACLERLGGAALRVLSAKRLLDLEAARKPLNPTSRNSSLPPSWAAPWDKTRASAAGAEWEEAPEDTVAEAAQNAADPAVGAGPGPAAEIQPMARRRAGQAPGAQGPGRPRLRS